MADTFKNHSVSRNAIDTNNVSQIKTELMAVIKAICIIK